MNKYIVRQPIKDRQQNILGYEILFQMKNESLYNQTKDFAVADTISGFLMQNNEKVFSDKNTFMTFSPNLLFKNTPKMFKQKDLVIQVEDNVIIHPLAQNLISRFKKEGFQIAINDFKFAPHYFTIMDSVDYIKIDFSSKETGSFANIVRLAKGFQKKCIATKVDTKERYDMAQELEVDYFQGSYIAENMITKANKTDYLQSNFFQLVVAVTKDEPDMDEIEEIISRDAALTYAILKMVNSVYFAVRTKTTSIKQALVILGIGQLKQWVYILSFNQKGSSSSEEILKMSFLRARLCSHLVEHIKNIPISKSEAYLMGMFSTLEYLVNAPIEEILEGLPVIDEIKKALISQEGICGVLYNLVLSYEKADWASIEKYSKELEMDDNIIAQIYFNCVEEVNYIWESIMSPYKNQVEAKAE